MPDQHRIGRVRQQGRDDLRRRHRRDVGIHQPHRVARVDQRPANGQKAEGRQQLPRHARPDGTVGRVKKGNLHRGTPGQHPASLPSRARGVNRRVSLPLPPR